ncbi:hypothetical protein [Bradyrhizobium sp. USDA 4469]
MQGRARDVRAARTGLSHWRRLVRLLEHQDCFGEGFLCLLDKKAFAINENDAGAKFLRAAKAGVIAGFKGFNNRNILDGDKALSDSDDMEHVFPSVGGKSRREERIHTRIGNQSLAWKKYSVVSFIRLSARQ